MHVKEFKRILLPLIVIIFSTALTAPGAAAATAEQLLRQYQREAESIESEQAAMRARLDELKQALVEAEQSGGPEKEAVEKAREYFNEASEAHEQSPNAQTEARLRNAEFKLFLAERRFRDANKEFQQLESEFESTQSKMSRLRQRLTELNRNIEQQQTVVERQERLRQEQELRKTREELARLKTQLAEEEQRKSEAAQPTASLSTESGAPATDAPASRPQSAPEAQPERPQATAHSRPDTPLELDRNFFLLATPELVAQEKERLQRTLDGRRLNVRSNKILNVRYFEDGAEAGNASYRFEGLGNYQYKTEAALKPGENRIRVQFDRWTVHLDDSVPAGKYVFLMNAADSGNPRITCYPVALD